MHQLQGRVTELQQQDLSGERIHDSLARFSPIWESLTVRERERLLKLLIQRVTYTGESEELSVTFRPNGIKSIEMEVEA